MSKENKIKKGYELNERKVPKGQLDAVAILKARWKGKDIRPQLK